jgi:hypothetical protein
MKNRRKKRRMFLDLLSNLKLIKLSKRLHIILTNQRSFDIFIKKAQKEVKRIVKKIVRKVVWLEIPG